MSAKEKEAAAKQTFTFLAPLTNEYPVKQDYFMNNIEKNRIEEYGQNII